MYMNSENQKCLNVSYLLKKGNFKRGKSYFGKLIREKYTSDLFINNYIEGSTSSDRAGSQSQLQTSYSLTVICFQGR